MENSVHPTESGGGGRPFVKFATPKPGDPDDDKIHCAQCGFAFRTETDQSGDTSDSPGITKVDTAIPISNTQSKLPIHLQGNPAFSAASRVVPVATVTDGCRLCGTYNPTGKQSREFDNVSKDMSGR